MRVRGIATRALRATNDSILALDQAVADATADAALNGALRQAQKLWAAHGPRDYRFALSMGFCQRMMTRAGTAIVTVLHLAATFAPNLRDPTSIAKSDRGVLDVRRTLTVAWLGAGR